MDKSLVDQSARLKEHRSVIAGTSVKSANPQFLRGDAFGPHRSADTRPPSALWLIIALSWPTMIYTLPIWSPKTWKE